MNRHRICAVGQASSLSVCSRQTGLRRDERFLDLIGRESRQDFRHGAESAKRLGVVRHLSDAAVSEGTRRGCEKIGSGTSQPIESPTKTVAKFGARPIFSQPRSVHWPTAMAGHVSIAAVRRYAVDGGSAFEVSETDGMESVGRECVEWCAATWGLEQLTDNV